MKVELFRPESHIEPRHWVRHDQAFAMMVGRVSMEWGLRRSALEKFDYAAGDLALCDRHIGEWVGLMNVPHLQLGISDAALTASSDGAYGEVELRPSRKFANTRLRALVAAAHAEMVAGFPSGRLFRKSTGETPHQFLLGQRVERAKAMLRAPDTRVLDVAVACGFKTSSTLRRSFVMSAVLAIENIAGVFWVLRRLPRRKPAPEIGHCLCLPFNSLLTSRASRICSSLPASASALSPPSRSLAGRCSSFELSSPLSQDSPQT